MTPPPRSRVATVTARTALLTTGAVLVLYLAVAVIVLAIVEHNLTADVDHRLSSALSTLQASTGQPSQVHGDGGGGGGQPGGDGHGYAAPPDQQQQQFGPALLIWTVDGGGQVFSNGSAVLPDTAKSVSSPTTATIAGADVRLAGDTVGADHVVVGQSLAGLYATRSQIILAEVFVGPVLLLIVFLGALTVGRRVAAPIELARRRQMEFTADASHELRTPLSVIEAQTHLALSQERDAAWLRRAFQRVEVESTRIRHLVEDLLWLARFDATKGGSRSEPVDLGSLARGAADRFGAVAEARGLTLTVTQTGGDPPIVSAPPEWLDRLLGVLLDNACKYSPRGGTVHVHAGVDGPRARLVVNDSGPGIPTGERSRIFDRFHRATDTTGGAGLGLAIADAVVRSSGGRWELGDAAGGGASMAVSWSRVLAPSRTSTAGSVRAATTR